MSPVEILAVIGLSVLAIITLGLSFLGFLVVMKVIWFARGTRRADRAAAVALAEKEKADAESNPDVPAP